MYAYGAQQLKAVGMRTSPAVEGGTKELSARLLASFMVTDMSLS